MSEDPVEVAGTKAALHGLCDSFYRDYDMATDRDLFVNLLSKYKEDIAAELLPSFFNPVFLSISSNSVFVNTIGCLSNVAEHFLA